MNISIGKVEAIHTVVVAAAGLLIAGLLAYGALRLEQEQALTGVDAVYMSDLERLQDSARQWLLMGDLIYASGVTYLVEGASSQAHLASEILETLTASSFGPNSQSELSSLQALFNNNEARLQQAATLSPETEADTATHMLGMWDHDAAQVVQLLQVLSRDMQLFADTRRSSMLEFRRTMMILGTLSGLVYLSLVLIMWAWVRAKLVNPLLKLTEAADEALHTDGSLTLQENGPIEVRRLTRSTKAFANQLEQKVAERTQSLRERESALIEEVATRQTAEGEAASALIVAEQASNAKSEFLANMSHEIRTPLNGILGGAQLALQEATNEEQQYLLQTVMGSGEQLLGVINDVLDFSKIDAGQFQLDNEAFDLSSVLGDIAKMFAAAAAEKHLELILFIDPNTPTTLIGDGLRVRQVLSNLINNAIKFTNHGEVVVHAALMDKGATQAKILISVQNSGIGIPEDKQEQVFNPFQQADGSSTRHWGGTGLGLSICRQIVGLMGGDIRLQSTPDVGSTFFCEIDFGLDVDAIAKDDTSGINAKTFSLQLKSETLRNALLPHLQKWGVQTNDGPGTDVLVVDTESLQNLPSQTQMMFPLIIELKLIDQASRLSPGTGRLTLPRPVLPGDLQQAIKVFFARGEESMADCSTQTLPIVEARSNVLLVEDNPVNQMIARKMLLSLGCEVTIASSGEAGVEAVQSDSYDLVLMDWHMPGMDGLQATRLIRTWECDRNHQRTAIVALTANALAGDAEQCLAAGMDGYLAKPVNLEALARVLSDRA